jgi:hypothetical protein
MTPSSRKSSRLVLDGEGTRREHRRGQPRPRAATRLLAIPSLLRGFRTFGFPAFAALPSSSLDGEGAPPQEREEVESLAPEEAPSPTNPRHPGLDAATLIGADELVKRSTSTAGATVLALANET